MTGTATAPPVRIAKSNGTCHAPNCRHQICPGAKIIKPPGRAWRHADCSAPGRRSKADRDAKHARIEAGRRR